MFVQCRILYQDIGAGVYVGRMFSRFLESLPLMVTHFAVEVIWEKQ